MSDIQIKKITEIDDFNLNIITDWMYNWWGQEEGYSKEAIKHTMLHSLCNDRLPQTFFAFENNEIVGMYQFSYHDLDSRPDIFPWLCNVYVRKDKRKMGVFSQMMKTVPENARLLGLNKIYLFTEHFGLYEKFGWVFQEDVKTFLPGKNIQRLYYLKF